VEDWTGTYRVNLTGAINVFDSARQGASGPVPVVYVSSAAVYGDNDRVPLAEDAATRPLTAYGADKLGCELHARVATHVHGVPTRGLRFFNIYGPRQDPKSPYSGVISIFTDRIAAGTAVDIHGDGGQTRDFIFVSDAVRFLLRAMAGSPSGPELFNVCNGIGTSIEDLAHILMDISGNRVELHHVDARPGDIRASIGNPEQARLVLGITTQVLVAEGLKQTYASLI
jgi:UDP-glucose 4-epimerase